MDPRRLADLALAVPVGSDASRAEAKFLSADFAMEDPRQPAPQPRRPDPAGAARRRVDVAAGRTVVLDDRRADRDGVAAATARRAGAGRTATGAIVPGVLAESAAGYGNCLRADRAGRDVSCLPHLGHRPRDCLDTRAARDHETAPARMGNRGIGGRASGGYEG